MRANGVTWHPEIEMRACGGAAGSRPHYAVFAKNQIYVGQAVVNIPKVRFRCYLFGSKIIHLTAVDFDLSGTRHDTIRAMGVTGSRVLVSTL